jgi:hypothetical protein
MTCYMYIAKITEYPRFAIELEKTGLDNLEMVGNDLYAISLITDGASKSLLTSEDLTDEEFNILKTRMSHMVYSERNEA